MVFGPLLIASGTTGSDYVAIPTNRLLVAFMQTGSTGLKPQIQDGSSNWYDIYTENGTLINALIAGRWYPARIMGQTTYVRLYKAGGFTYLYAYYELAAI